MTNPLLSPPLQLATPDVRSARFPLLLGFNAQVAQLLLLREALILSNGSEAALGISLAAWALFNGLGAWGGSFLSRWFDPGRFFRVALLVLPLLLALSIHGARIARSLVELPGGEPLPMLWFSGLVALVLAPVTGLDGFLFVAALDRLFKGTPQGKDTAQLYGLESAGSLVGGLLFSFCLVFFFDPFASAGLLCCINGLLLFPVGRSRWLRGLVLAVGVGALVFGSQINRVSEASRWQVLQPGLRFLESRETRYQNLAVLGLEEEHALFGNGHLLFSLRAHSPEEAGDWSRALFVNFAMLQHGAPRNVLLVGGGAKGFISDLLEYGPEKIDWVEYDRDLVDLAGAYQLAEEKRACDSPNVRFHERDGRYHLKNRAPGSLDLILLDLPDPVNANLNRYYTEEFFAECRRVLAPRGVLVLGLTCQPNYIGESMRQRNGSVYAALQAVFPQVLITPGTFSFLAAGSEQTTLTAEADRLLARYQERGMASKRFSPYLFYTAFEEDDLAWIEKTFSEGLENSEFQRNQDDRPVAYYADFQIFSEMTGTSAWMHRAMCHSASGWILVVLPIAGLLLLALARVARFRQSRSEKGLYLLTAATIGFCGIVLEIAVLISYQNCSGYLYSQMGVIIAAYMAGLSLGALITHGQGAARRALLFSMGAMGLGLGLYYGLIPWLTGRGPGEWAGLIGYLLVTLMFGASGGLAFRGVSLAMTRHGLRVGGRIYTLDILGTCLGGWQAGNVLIPALGIEKTLVFAAATSLALSLFCFLAQSCPARSS